MFEGQEATNVGLNAVAGRPPDEYGVEPTKFSEMRPGCFDIHERIRDMNANGVVASMNFPSYPQFCGQYFARATDKDLALAVLRAYNDWHIDEWCGTYPGRMIPLALPPIWDPQLMADEVRRVAKKGCHAVTLLGKPDEARLPVVARRALGSVLAGVLRREHRRVPPHRFVVAGRRSPRSTRRSTR